MNKKETHSIVPSDFFSKQGDKIKLNWFCFEYALELQSDMLRMLGKRLEISKIGPMELKKFCIGMANMGKDQVLLVTTGMIGEVHFHVEDIERLLPQAKGKLIEEVAKVCIKSWVSLTDGCSFCPTRCITERFKACNLFDDPEYY